MKNIITYLIKSILAGIMIAIGGTIFLSLENQIVGAFMFAVGLFVIVTTFLNLFTGKVGYIFNNSISYLTEVGVTLVGNFIGTFFVGISLRNTRVSDLISEKAKNMCEIKVDDNIFSIFILSVFCGTLMYIAVNGYKTIQDSVGKNIIVFITVATFILCGFEHCIANMYYFTIADMWSLKAFAYLLVMILGNSVGAVIIPIADKMIKRDKKIKELYKKAE